MMSSWFGIQNHDKILSPALLFYPDRIRANIQKMIRIAGSPDRLRPHVKTYKCKEVVAMQMAAGITGFKCATLAEAQMLAECGVPDVLVAYPLAGASQRKLINIASQYPETVFSTLIDHREQVRQWQQHLEGAINCYVDLDVGMHRSGICVNELKTLLRSMDSDTFNLLGFHAYDGHIRDTDITGREEHVKRSFREAEQFLDTYDGPTTFIAGGSITFPIHAKYPSRMLSPGTTLLWDRGYGESFPDLGFDVAATLLTRVVSKPGAQLLCLDLGYKAVASEMKGHPPVSFPQLSKAKLTGHSEEHLVLKTRDTGNWKVGDVLYGFPWHICPTVAMHAQAGIVKNGSVQTFWEIASRDRFYFLNE